MVQILEEKVVRLAIISRLIAIGQLFICSFLPHHESDAFNPPINVHGNFTDLDVKVLNRLSGFLNWDSRYFHFVSNHGYIYQNSLAFFPLFPLLVQGLTYTVFFPLRYLLNDIVVSAIAGIVLNNVCFVMSSRLLYRLSCWVIGDNTMAYKAALIYCFNPASVFFSVFYSESLFIFLSLLGFLLLECHYSIWAASIFGVSTSCRTNGILSSVFMLHRAGYMFILKVRRNLQTKSLSRSMYIFSHLKAAISLMFSCMISVILVFLPLILTQLYGYFLYCYPKDKLTHPAWKMLYSEREIPKSLSEYGQRQDYLMIGTRPPWCENLIPFSYPHIQSTHWNVGFLKYYEIRQLPNFALATPVILAAIFGIHVFTRQYSTVSKTLGLDYASYTNIKYRREAMIVRRLSPYVLHMLVILAAFVFTTHIQIITRVMFSSSPAIYWILSYILCDKVFVYAKVSEIEVFQRAKKRSTVYSKASESERGRFGNLLLDDVLNFFKLKFSQKLILLYLSAYFVFGIFAHGVSLPWT